MEPASNYLNLNSKCSKDEVWISSAFVKILILSFIIFDRIKIKNLFDHTVNSYFKGSIKTIKSKLSTFLGLKISYESYTRSNSSNELALNHIRSNSSNKV